MRSALTAWAAVLLLAGTAQAQSLIPAEAVPLLDPVPSWHDELPLAGPGPGPAPAEILTPRLAQQVDRETLPAPMAAGDQYTNLPHIPDSMAPYPTTSYRSPSDTSWRSQRSDAWDLIHERAWNEAEERRMRIAERQRQGISLARPVWSPVPYTGGGLTSPSPQAVRTPVVEAVPYSSAGVRGNASDSSAMRRDESPYDSYQYFSDAP
jgi:hypothetical protein